MLGVRFEIKKILLGHQQIWPRALKQGGEASRNLEIKRFIGKIEIDLENHRRAQISDLTKQEIPRHVRIHIKT